MMPLRPLVMVAALLACASSLLFADTPTELPPGADLATQEDFEAAGDHALYTLERAAEPSEQGEVWSVHTTHAAKEPWLVQLTTDLRGAAKKGDSGLVIAQVRAVETSHESDQARFRFVVSDKKKAFPRIAVASFSVDRRWREIALPFSFNRDYAAGEAMAAVDLGYGLQTIEIAGLRVLNYGDVALDRLPRTRVTYVGHEAGAPWRRAAEARIERIRKGDLSVEVTDAEGRPVPDAGVRAVLDSHAFQFGSVVNVEMLSIDSPDTEIYRRRALSLFNALSLENGLKWSNWTGDGKGADYRERTLETLQWIKDHDLPVRGHVMVWPGWRFLPGRIKSLRGTPDQARIPGLVLEHIRDIALATKDHVSEWDVLNEPVSNHDLMDLFGRGIMVDWFKEAGRLLPGVPLFLNDWGNHDQRANAAHVKEFEDIALYLREQGAPLHGIGLQGHIGSILSPPEDILATLDRYEQTLGLPVRVTEFDVTTDDEEIQADYTRDFLTVMFSHPSVIGVQFWGFWEGRHWQPKAALYRQDWTEKPNGAAYRKLIEETWHTDATGVTDARGRWTARGFYGRYTVTVTVGDAVHTVVVRHEAGDDDVVRVTLPGLPDGL